MHNMQQAHIITAWVAPVACIPAWPVAKPLPTAPPVRAWVAPLPPVQAAYDPLRSRSYASCNVANARLPGLQRPHPNAKAPRYGTTLCAVRCMGGCNPKGKHHGCRVGCTYTCTQYAAPGHRYCHEHKGRSYGCAAHDKQGCREASCTTG